jgi:hypothetical protein
VAGTKKELASENKQRTISSTDKETPAVALFAGIVPEGADP